jgi:hypothetical protein
MQGIVYGATYESADWKLNEIIQNYEQLGIRPTYMTNHSKWNNWVEYENGDTWRAVRAGDSARGYKTNIAYIDNRISREIIRTIIMPSNIGQPFHAYKFF